MEGKWIGGGEEGEEGKEEKNGSGRGSMRRGEGGGRGERIRRE